MRHLIPGLFLLVFVAMPARPDDAAQDIVLYLDRPQAKVMFVLPAESRPVRGVIVHGPNMKRKPSPRWTETARELGFAHMVCSIDMKKNRRPRRLRENVPAALSDIADHLGMPELKTAPLGTTGHSAGGMTLSALLPLEDRLLTSANDCSWIMKQERVEQFPYIAKTPLLFTIGAIPDDFKMIPAIEQQYDPTRAAGAPWGLGFEWGKAHSFANAGTLFSSWFQAIAELRVAEAGLQDIDVETGWLGDRATWDTPYATIAPYAEYEGDKSVAVWLPTKAFAHTWRAYQSKASPWQLTASVEGGKGVGPIKPGKGAQLEMHAGQEVTLSVQSVVEGRSLARVRFFHEDQVIGEADGEPWAATWTPPGAGAYPVHAEWTDGDGKIGVTNSALFVVQPGHAWKTIDLRDPRDNENP